MQLAPGYVTKVKISNVIAKHIKDRRLFKWLIACIYINFKRYVWHEKSSRDIIIEYFHFMAKIYIQINFLYDNVWKQHNDITPYYQIPT